MRFQLRYCTVKPQIGTFIDGGHFLEIMNNNWEINSCVHREKGRVNSQRSWLITFLREFLKRQLGMSWFTVRQDMLSIFFWKQEKHQALVSPSMSSTVTKYLHIMAKQDPTCAVKAAGSLGGAQQGWS